MPSKFIQSLTKILESHGAVQLAILFGSVPKGEAQYESDIDVAVRYRHSMSTETRLQLIEELALLSGRPVDLVDLEIVGEPLLGQILLHGQRLLGSDGEYGKLLSRHLLDQADFMPYRTRILEERRAAWIGS